MKIKKSKKKVLTEKQIQNQIMKFLSEHGFSADVITIGTYGRRGMSDIVACAPDGTYIAIEVKREGKKATRIQEEWLAEKRKHNAVSFVACSVNDVKDGLSKWIIIND